MAIIPCSSYVDRYGREQVVHGSTLFPIACYHNDLLSQSVPWHWHEELEAGIVTEGSAVITVGQKKYILHAGDGFFINSGILHGAYASDAEECIIHSMVFHPRLVGGTPDSIFYRRYLRPLLENPTLEWISFHSRESGHQEALSAIRAGWSSCVEELPGYEFSVRNALSALIWQLHCHSSQHKQLPSTKEKRDAERIKLMLSYVHENFGSDLNTHAIAASAAISESECLRCFRSSIGTTPIQYLKQYRLRQAAIQLSSTEDKVSEIAERCGFQDMSYFTKSFREAEGVTPSEFRKSRSL